MKGLLRRLHFSGGSQDDYPEGAGSLSKSRNRFSFSETSSATPPSESPSPSSESRTLSSFSGWLHAAKQTLQQGGSPKQKKEDVDDKKDEGSNSRHTDKKEVYHEVEDEKQPSCPAMRFLQERKSSDAATGTSSAAYKDAQEITVKQVQGAAHQVVSDQDLFLQDEELQLRVALAQSVYDDPEAAAIENAKYLSLKSEFSLSNTAAEMLAYQYWRYNVLKYDDNVADGFYDVYGVASDVSSEMMPALVDLEEVPVSDKISWEVVLVNRATDNNLVNLEQRAISIAVNLSDCTGGLKRSSLANRIAHIVADQMGGPVNDDELLHRSWGENITELRASLGNVVLPLGCLQIGLSRHRALLFKVLADAVGIPCQLLKGKQYTGSDEGAVNIIKIDTGREYIIDLMGAPGTLFPSDLPEIGSSGSNLNLDQEDLIQDDTTFDGSKVHESTCILKDAASGVNLSKYTPNVNEAKPVKTHRCETVAQDFKELHAIPERSTKGRSVCHWRSPSWTEGISSPSIRGMKVKDVSQYMMDAAKENPKLAQKLHDVLVESGVKAPPDLFGEIFPTQLKAQINEERKVLDERHVRKAPKGITSSRKERSSVGPGRPPTPKPSFISSSAEGEDRINRLNSVEGLGETRPLDPPGLNLSPGSLTCLSSSSGAATLPSAAPMLPAAAAVSLVQENLSPELIKHVPVAAAAAAVVASSMVAAASKAEHGSDPTLEVPVAAAATATAAVVVATTAVVSRRMEIPLAEPIKKDKSEKGDWQDLDWRNKEADAYVQGTGDGNNVGQGTGGAEKRSEDDTVVDKSTCSMSIKSNRILEDAAEWEISWEELVIGERIGLGSYGEVYRADWHGTEVAVKKFLAQDISGDALEEFRSEVRLMKRMCHPNVVLFMGAVMRPPNLSIVTEFLHRGSLYRLIQRSNGQLDERRRMRMALDVARGMNYLHNSTPIIVHRDLKSPNLLVDKNWVVKVCDFGLSRLKHNTFLSSKSTAGTPEWMAPEVLRNEPSNEKSDVYSFGVILWELATLQQPWAGMNPMQVVGAVGFQQRTLDIPENMDPVIVKIIQQCWQSDPALRPSFAEIMATLKPLQRPLTQAQSVKA